MCGSAIKHPVLSELLRVFEHRQVASCPLPLQKRSLLNFFVCCVAVFSVGQPGEGQPGLRVLWD